MLNVQINFSRGKLILMHFIRLKFLKSQFGCSNSPLAMELKQSLVDMAQDQIKYQSHLNQVAVFY